MSPRRVRQLALDGMHTYREPQPTRSGYRPRCACGWRGQVAPTKRAAQGKWREHSTSGVGRGV